MVRAVVAGDADGIAEVYDRYAGSLYAYGHWLLPGPEAAGVVQDTFLIAVSRLDGLRDPDQLDAWLHAVARNECLRRLGPGSPGGAGGPARAAEPVPGSAGLGELPAVTLPAELRGRVLTACADNSPVGRAHRVSVTHRAGAFGPSGFPKAIGPAGPRWWQRMRRHPRPVAAAGVLVAVAAAAGITVITTAAGAQRPQASALGLGAGVAGTSPSAIPGSAIPGSASRGGAARAGAVRAGAVRAGAVRAGAVRARHHPRRTRPRFRPARRLRRRRCPRAQPVRLLRRCPRERNLRLRRRPRRARHRPRPPPRQPRATCSLRRAS